MSERMMKLASPEQVKAMDAKRTLKASRVSGSPQPDPVVEKGVVQLQVPHLRCLLV
ncbi:UNVERIFIED_CONTAM: hypothetical protein Slati_2541300 [Sesamum latifolium]|uniref:Uncharacterized protein n=1 Tax=Sesamum latifolium TaxID=2727402 RepID=A0AAW2WGP3_9LAMI